MAHTLKILGTIAVCLSLLFLAACSSPTPTSTTTPDLNPLRTEVAATVLAQVTQALALTPSATLIPSLTATLPLTSTPTQAASVTPLVTATLAGGTVTATLTTQTPAAASDNRAEWVSQSIPDDTTFAPGETFTMTWRLKNVGASTWTAGYVLRYYSGETFGALKEIPLGRDVPPGVTVDITLAMKAPARAGVYTSVWVMSDEKRSNFKEPVYLRIIVAVPATPTRSPSPTPGS